MHQSIIKKITHVDCEDFLLFLFSWYDHVYPKYCQRYKEDDNQWTHRLYLWNSIFWLFEFDSFKCVATLVLKFKRYKAMIRHFIAPFIQTQKQKQLLMKVTLMMYLNQSTLLLYKTYKNL